MTTTNRSTHYIDKDHLYSVVCRDKAAGKLSDELAGMLMLIAENYSNHPWFNRYSYKEDLVGHALLKLCSVWHKFDETKSNQAFSYYTTVTYRAFGEYLKRERKQVRAKNALAVELGVDLALLDQLEAEDAATTKSQTTSVAVQD